MTKQDLPLPLTPVDCDLRDFAFMPLDVVRLFSSEFHAAANDAEWRAGVTLWCKAWHQVPAGALPDDDAALARLADLGKDLKSWHKMKAKALHGWIKCNDGRLYHPVVAEKALGAWIEKLGQRKASAAGNATRWGSAPFEPEAFNLPIRAASQRLAALNPQAKTLRRNTAVNAAGAASGNASGNANGSTVGSTVGNASGNADSNTDENANGNPESMPGDCQERERSKNKNDAAPLRDARQEGFSEPGSSPPPVTPKAWIFTNGLPWLQKQLGRNEPSCRRVLGKWIDDAGGNAAVVQATIEAAQHDPPVDPIPWITQGIKIRLQSQQPDPFEATDPCGWDRRLAEHKHGGVWLAKWGGTGPGDHPGHRLASVAPIFAQHGYVFEVA